MEPTVSADVYRVDGEPMFIVEGELFTVKRTKEVQQCTVDESFVFNGYVFTVVRSPQTAPVVRDGVPDIDNCVAKYRGIWGASNHADVHVIERAERVDMDDRIRCTVCGREFWPKSNGLDYDEQAAHHVRSEHLGDDEVELFLDHV